MAVGVVIPEDARDAEVAELGLAAPADQDVLGLDVAMEHAPRVSGPEAGRDLVDEGDGLAQRNALVAEQAATKALAVDKLHDEVVGALLAALVEDVDDVGMGELGERRGLSVEALDEVGLPREPGQEHLERHGPIERELGGLVDHGHPAAAHQPLDAAAGQLVASTQPHPLGRRHVDGLPALRARAFRADGVIGHDDQRVAVGAVDVHAQLPNVGIRPMAGYPWRRGGSTVLGRGHGFCSVMRMLSRGQARSRMAMMMAL